MGARQTYTVDSSRVVHETINGEAILLDLERGTYYSLTGAGPDIWSRLIAGWSRDEVVAAAGDDLAADTSALIDALCAAALLRESHGAETATANGDWQSRETPVLQTYTDMEYFLMLDPVHEVQAAGWPHAATDAPAGPS